MNLHWKEGSVLKLLFFSCYICPQPHTRSFLMRMNNFVGTRWFRVQQLGQKMEQSHLFQCSLYLFCSYNFIGFIYYVDGGSRLLPPQTFCTISKISNRKCSHWCWISGSSQSYPAASSLVYNFPQVHITHTVATVYSNTTAVLAAIFEIVWIWSWAPFFSY